MLAPQLPAFYTDLRDPDYETALAVFHQRYSTNTLPNWLLAQPFRLLAHNGEINTLQGNRNWMRAREASLTSPVWGDAVERCRPIIWEAGLRLGQPGQRAGAARSGGPRRPARDDDAGARRPGRTWPRWSRACATSIAYHALLIEPWDGPAALAFTDGTIVGAVLDRNGLRPRATRSTEDGLVVAASEVGVVRHGRRRRRREGPARPGQMLAVDTVSHRILQQRRPEARDRRAPAVRRVDLARAGQPVEPADRPARTARPAMDERHASPRLANGQARRRHRGGCRRRRCHRRGRRPDADPARVRLHRRRGQVHHPADGRRGQGPHLLDGRRHPDGGPLAACRACCTRSSSSASPRSPTRRSTRSARSW